MGGAAQRTKVGDLAKEYCENWPNTGSRTLAKMMTRDHPMVWVNLDAARSAVRRCRGSMGKHNRECTAADTRFYDQTAEARQARIEIPESDAEEWTPHTMPDGYGLVLADLHIPYHEPRLIKAALEHAKAQGATDWCLLNGDIMDCYRLSRWVKDPEARNFDGERDMTWQMFDYIRQELDTDRLIYKLGNHEVRLESYMKQKAPEAWACEETRFHRMLRLPEMGIEHVEAEQIIECGHLTILHGHEWGGSFFSPVNPARGAFLRAKDCVLVGHQHQTSHHTEPTIREKQISCWSVGCGCELHPKYRPLNKWNWGFALLEKRGRNFDIENRRLLPDGELV